MKQTYQKVSLYKTGNDSDSVSKQRVIIPDECAYCRVDQVASILMPSISRTKLRNCILSGELQINNQTVKPAHRVRGGEIMQLNMVHRDVVADSPERIDFDVVHQEQHFFIVNKPAGLVVHPAAGNASGTLLNGLLHIDPKLAQLPRAGIVHRLDKETSGILVVARSETARQSLIAQLKKKVVSRMYIALCHGCTKEHGTIDTQIGRHPVHRKKMAVINNGKNARTHYKRIQTFAKYSLLQVLLETGRTHQIRVHLHSIGHPLVGDATYKAKNNETTLQRQALHAKQIVFSHPVSGKMVTYQTQLANDFQDTLDSLQIP